MAGVGLRAWREHRHAAFVGMVAQSCASAQLQFGGVTRCAYPALTWLVNTTAAKMEGGEEDDSEQADSAQYAGTRPIALMVGDLERAWGASVSATKAAYPAMRARQAGGAAHWLRATQVGEAEGQIRRILRMPTQAQRQLSKAVNKLTAERVEREFEEAEERGDVAAGWLRQLFTFCRAAGVGEYRRAIPFMADGEMHIAYHEEMLNFVLEFGCLPPLDIRVPDDFGGEEWESRWEDYVACGAAVPEAASRDAWMYYVKELHTRFEGYECCIDASVARTAAHEDLKVLFAALAKNAGAIAVALEPRGWDEGGAYDKHKRPDIEWINAVTRQFTITDVTIDWTMTVGSGTEHAAGAEKRKVDAYATAMQRNRESAARARRQPDDFAPLGFAKNGAWGPQAQRIFKDLCAMLSVRTMSADLYGWSAMTFEKHWLQRIGVTQARARAALLTEGVRSRQQAACEVPWGPGVETVSMQYEA